jgi:hypothetical protein
MTTEEIVTVAKNLWNDCKLLRKKKEWIDKEPKDVMAYFYQTHYKDFITKYSIPSRYMFFYSEFSEKAFRRYLMRMTDPGYKSKEEWIERQADYVRLLYAQYNKHVGPKELAAVWQKARKQLVDEYESFERDYEKAKKEADEKKIQAEERLRASVINLSQKDQNLQHKLAELMMNDITTSND